MPQTQPFAQGYSDVKEASVTNLPRIYQAFYSAFSGSPQKTIGQQAGGGLPVSLNETGIQTGGGSHSGYTGAEANTVGVTGNFASEEYQASWYKQMLDLLACDPNIQFVNIFHLIDEPAREGWQSGLYFADESAKKSAQFVHDWIAQTAGRCVGTVHPWTPTGVAGCRGEGDRQQCHRCAGGRLQAGGPGPSVCPDQTAERQARHRVRQCWRR
jgi:hypothetical protein